MASEQSQAFYEQFLTALKSKYNPDLIKGIYIFCKSFYEAEYFIVIFMCTVQKHFVSYMEYTVIELKEEWEKKAAFLLPVLCVNGRVMFCRWLFSSLRT